MSAKVHPETEKREKKSVFFAVLRFICRSKKEELGQAPNGDQVSVTSTPRTATNHSVSAVTTEEAGGGNDKHGRVHFWRNFSYDLEGRPFLRVNHDGNIEDVCNFMTQEWKIPMPRIVLLLITNVAPLTQWTNSRQIKSFQKGLMDAANTTDMWILTNGIDIGLTKVIGDAVQEEMHRRLSKGAHQKTLESRTRIVIIGVAREDLLNHSDFFDGKNRRLELENEGNRLEEHKFDLNPDHSHYLIVRDSTINKTGINYFLLRLQHHLATSMEHPRRSASKERGKHSQLNVIGNMEIPVIALLVQGGTDCARLVPDHMRRHFPLVVMRGTGGLADVLGFAHSEISQRPHGIADAEFTETYLKPELARKISDRFPNLQDNSLSRNMVRDRIIDCMRFAKQNDQTYLTVLNLFEQHSCNLDNLGNLLLRALFKSQKKEHTNWHAQMQKDLYLTLDWNSPNVATSEVFLKDPYSKFKIDKEVFEEALLRSQRENFVDLFLSQGFQVHKYLTPRRLVLLFKKVLKQEFFETVLWEGAFGYGPMSKMRKDFIENDLNWIIEKTTGISDFVVSQELSLNAMGMYTSDPSSAERKARVLLAFWATLTNRMMLAKVLWKHADQPIHLALVLSMMIERLIPYVHEANLKLEMRNSSKDFAEIATAMLDACYQDSPCRAFDVLNEDSPEWSYGSAVDIAAEARNRLFLSHICCQKWLTNEFFGKIRVRDLSWGLFTLPSYLKILICAFLVFPTYGWIVFESEEYHFNEDEKETAEQESDDEADDAFLIQGDSQERPHEVTSNNLNRSGTWRKTEYLKNYVVAHPPLWKMIYLVWSAPITKFWMYQAFYIVFLALFSVAVMWPSCGNPEIDLVVCIWMSLIALESIHPALKIRKKRKSSAFLLKISETVVMAIFVMLYIMGRLASVPLFNSYTMRVILCVELLFFYYRIIAIFLPISPTLGPLLYRVRLMVLVDFVNFMRMTILVIISGGIVIHAVMYPDYPFDAELFRRTFHKAWFSLFLTPISDLTEDKTCSLYSPPVNDTTTCNAGGYSDWMCPNVGFWAYVFNIQYFVLLKLILLTLLYALFSATATKLAAESDAIWKYQRYHLVVDFSNRLIFPAPLNVISYSIILLQGIAWLSHCVCCYVFKRCTSQSTFSIGINKDRRYSTKDYIYWNQLAEEYTTREQTKVNEIDLLEKHITIVQNMMDDFTYQKQMIHQLKASVRDLERLLNYSHVHLESISHLTHRDNSLTGQWDILLDSSQTVVKSVTNLLARRSPYPGTKVQRFPVPDKYVPWEVMWVSYDPVAFTQPRGDFIVTLQAYVDEDILLLREKQSSERAIPVYAWNSVQPMGMALDRQSWITSRDGSPLTYGLDSEGVPQNAMGRTGLRGRGSLPRWGPNHYVLIIITRFQRSKECLLPNRGLEFVVLWTEKRFHLSIPGGFVSGEHRYEVIRSIFKTSTTGNTVWQSADSVINFFRERVVLPPGMADDEEVNLMELAEEKVSCEVVQKGYMDDPLNTDHAWKEVELWHVHYDIAENIADHLQPMMGWRLITEDAFFKLPAGQAVLLQDIARKKKATIL